MGLLDGGIERLLSLLVSDFKFGQALRFPLDVLFIKNLFTRGDIMMQILKNYLS